MILLRVSKCSSDPLGRSGEENESVTLGVTLIVRNEQKVLFGPVLGSPVTIDSASKNPRSFLVILQINNWTFERK